jgi:hypothetical protein
MTTMIRGRLGGVVLVVYDMCQYVYLCGMVKGTVVVCMTHVRRTRKTSPKSKSVIEMCTDWG